MGKIGKMMEIILHTEQDSTCNNPRASALGTDKISRT